MRSKVIRLAGVKILPDATSVFVGRGVVFDSIHPELITIEDHTHITEGCVILTHYLDTTVNTISWRYGSVHIKRGAFIGARTIITKPCTIGNNSIIGAGSVITKDVPDNEIWAGNPARFIKKRQK